jgi:hypothetical protein
MLPVALATNIQFVAEKKGKDTCHLVFHLRWKPRTDFNEINGVFIAPQGGENLYKILKAEQKKQRKKRRRLFFQQKT